ncbi:putative peptidoglycan-binding domain-containing protein, partial [Escherichia coli]
GQALEILEADYWYGPRFDQVEDLSPDIAAELCDTGVNMGPTVASRMLQRWLNVFNLRGKLYPDMDADGRIGPRTLNALRAYLKNRSRDGELVLVMRKSRHRAQSRTTSGRHTARSPPGYRLFMTGLMH